MSQDDSNPFTSPPTDSEPAPPQALSRFPSPVAAAVFLGVGLTAWQVFEYVAIGAETTPLQLTRLGWAVFTLWISLGLIARAAPVWALGRFYYLFFGGSSLLFGAMAIAYGRPALAVASGLGQALVCLVVYGALGQSAARKYYGLECPNCRHVNTQGDDLLCFQKRCTKCGFRW